MIERMENITKKHALKAYSLKAFVPALDFERSKAFYLDIGFKIRWEDAMLAHMETSRQGFLLQNFYVKELAENFVMHLMVESVDDWWKTINHVVELKKYNTHLSEPKDQIWGLRDFSFKDPSGVLWKVANEITMPASTERNCF